VARVDRLVGTRDPPGVRDLVAQRYRPAVLEQGDRGGRSLGDRVAQVPDRRVVAEVAVLQLGRSRDRPELGTLLVVGAEADERSHDGAELLRLLGVEVAALDDRDLAVVVLLDEQQIDQPNDVVLLQAVELFHDRPVEVVALEADDQHLHGAQRQTVAAVGRDAHTPCRRFCFCTSNSASVSTPCSCSCPSLPSCSIVLSVIPPPPPPPPWGGAACRAWTPSTCAAR